MRRFVFFVKMGALLCMAAGLLLPARAAAPSEQYLSTRRANPPLKGLTLDLARQRPDDYVGAALEVEGRLSGIARSGDAASLMIETDKDGTITLQMSEVPTWVQPGDRLRALVVIAGNKESGIKLGTPDLQVVTVASASDLSAAEARLQAEAVARAERERQQSDALSRASAILARRSNLPGSPRPSLDARVATLSRSLSPNAQAVYEPYRAAIRSYNRRLSERDLDAITTSILLFSERMDVDPRLVIAMVIAESDFDPHSTSNKGAMGLAQIMPDEARELGLSNPYDPVQNIGGAIYLLKGRLDKYSGGAAQKDLTMQHIILALASYNAGMGAVKKYGGVPPYRETQNYVKKIEKIYRRLCGGNVS